MSNSPYTLHAGISCLLFLLLHHRHHLLLLTEIPGNYQPTTTTTTTTLTTTTKQNTQISSRSCHSNSSSSSLKDVLYPSPSTTLLDICFPLEPAGFSAVPSDNSTTCSTTSANGPRWSTSPASSSPWCLSSYLCSGSSSYSYSSRASWSNSAPAAGTRSATFPTDATRQYAWQSGRWVSTNHQYRLWRRERSGWERVQFHTILEYTRGWRTKSICSRTRYVLIMLVLVASISARLLLHFPSLLLSLSLSLSLEICALLCSALYSCLLHRRCVPIEPFDVMQQLMRSVTPNSKCFHVQFHIHFSSCLRKSSIGRRLLDCIYQHLRNASPRG